MPIKVDLHDSTSQVKVGVKSTSEVPAMPGGESISDKRLEALLKKEIKDRIAGDEHLQEEIDELVSKGARYILIEEKEDGSIDVSLLNEKEEVLSTQTIHLTEKIIKESVLDYEHSKIIYTCNDNSTIELDISDIVSAINTVANDLNSEIERATTAEEAISQDLADEVSRATNEEARIDGKVDAETSRAEHAEQELTSALEAETDARMSGDSTLQDNIDAEATARGDADTLLQRNIDAEATTRSQEITRVEGLVSLEEGRAKGAERTLQTNIESEATARAAGDADLAARLSEETNRAFAAENAIQIELDGEEEARAHADDVLQGNIDAEETRAKGVESSLNTAIGNETTRATGAEQALGTRIDNLDLSAVGSDGGYIKTVSQTDGQVGATRQAFDTTIDSNSDNKNAPTSKAVKDYVDTYGGKIDSISIDGVEQQIVNKNVDLPAYPTRESLSIDNVDNTSDLNKPISTATQNALNLKQDEITSSNKLSSDLVDDTNDTNKFATQSQLDQIATNQSDIGDLNTALTNHKNDTTNPHSVTASQVGLGSVVNTGDSATPTQDGTTKFTTGGAYTLKTDLETAIGNVDNKLNQNVHTEGSSDEITYSGDTVTKTSPYINLKTGTTGSRSEVIHLANSTTAGLMSYTDYNQIRDNTDRIAALEGTPVRLIYTASQNPTASDIKTFVDNYLAGKGITNPTDSDYNSVSVKINGTNHIWNYYANDGAYKDDGLDTVTAFTNSIAGIILGSSNDGQVYAENDGTGSVYGWSALKTRVGNNETNITSLQNSKVDKVNGKGLSTNDFTDALKTKLDGIATGAEVNTIVGIQKNGTDLTPDSNRKVNISVPTKTSDINNDSDFTTNTYVNTELAKKQNTLDTQTAYTSKGSATKVPQITTNTLGQVTSITEVTITDNNDNQKVKAGNVTFGDNDVINFVGSGNTTVTGDASGKTITISSSDSHVGDVVSVGATSGSNIAIGGTSANPTVGVASGYSIPSDTKQGQWDAKYDKPSGGIPDADIASASTWNAKQDALSTQTAYTAKGSATKVPQITTNSLGQVTGITEITITQPVVNNGTLTIQKNGTTLDTFTANQSGNSTANITVPTTYSDVGAAAAHHLYHTWDNDTNYFDGFEGGNMFRIVTENMYADCFRFQASTVSNLEYYNGSSWVSWNLDISNLFDGNARTGISIPYANRKFRFQLTANGGWPTTALFMLQGTWFNDGGWPNGHKSSIIIETRASTSDAWSQKASFDLSGVEGMAGHTLGSLHTGNTLYRITIEIAPWTNTSNSCPLQRLCLFSNYNGGALEKITHDGNGNVTIPTLKSTTIYENGTSLANKYLGKTSKAADSDLLDGHDSSYFAPASALNGYLPLSGGTMTGPLSWSGETALPSKTLQYILGIDSFSSGGQTGWQSKSDFLSGYATESWVNNKRYVQGSPEGPRNFINGTLITTNINYSATSGDAFYLEIKADGYGYGTYLTQVNGYIYDDTIINYYVNNLGIASIDELYALNIDGVLCFWFPRLAYWQSFSATCNVSSSSNYVTNRVVSITDSAHPSGTKEVLLTASGHKYNNINDQNIGSQSVNYATSSGNADTVDSKHASDFVKFGGQSGASLGSDAPFADVTAWATSANLPNGNALVYDEYGREWSLLYSLRPDNLAYGAILKWGYADTYLRIARKSGSWVGSDWEKISAGYADSAGNADTLDGYHESSFIHTTGGTLTGALTFANSTYNTVGDDSQFGDIDVAGTLGIRGYNGQTALAFVNQYGSSSGQYRTRLVAPVVTENHDVYLPSAAGTLALTSQIPTVTNYYWADVKVSASSSKGTTPTFSTVTIGGSGSTAGKATMQYNTTEDCIEFVFA